MKSSAVVAALDMADSTLRKYANQYKEYLSSDGAGGSGRHRDYTEHDVRVLKLIRDMKLQNVADEDIDVTLRSLQAGGWDRLPALDDHVQSIIPQPGALIAANADRSAMQREIDLLREMLEKSDADREKLLGKIEDLQRQIGEQSVELRFWREGRLKPKE